MNVPIRYHITGRRASEIAESVERGIRDGELTAGTRLPTVRSLASHRGISTATVASAYRELRRRGTGRGCRPPRHHHRPARSARRRAAGRSCPPVSSTSCPATPTRRCSPDLGPAFASLPREPVLYGASGLRSRTARPRSGATRARRGAERPPHRRRWRARRCSARAPGACAARAIGSPLRTRAIPGSSTSPPRSG